LDYNSWRARDYTPEHYVGGSQGLNQSSLSKTFGISYRHILDNLLTFNDKVGDHSFSVLLGESTRNERKYSMIGTALNVPYIDEQSLYLSRGSASSLFVQDYIATPTPMLTMVFHSLQEQATIMPTSIWPHSLSEQTEVQNINKNGAISRR
jgi:hypothetical protein